MKYASLTLAFFILPTVSAAGDLILDLRNGAGATGVGAFRRWDGDGNPHQPINPKARIDQQEVTA